MTEILTLLQEIQNIPEKDRRPAVSDKTLTDLIYRVKHVRPCDFCHYYPPNINVAYNPCATCNARGKQL